MPDVDSVVVHPVAHRLERVGISKVVVIDDAYDCPNIEDLTTEIDEFWAEIIRNQKALSELRFLKPEITNEEDIDQALILQLWERSLKGGLATLHAPCRSILFYRQFEAQALLELIVANLSRMGIAVTLLGANDSLPQSDDKLFFLDFLLGGDLAPPGPGAVERAIDRFVAGEGEDESITASLEKAKAILTTYDDAFIVLMSSKDAAMRGRDRFREVTGLMEGMFDYVPKEVLAREKDLSLILGLSAAGLPARHDIQHFLEAFQTSVKEASNDFISRIRSLSFEDYLYLHSISLQGEGQPLGTYMSELYKALLAHLVHNHEAVIEAQHKLNSIDMTTYVALKRAPSVNLADAYRRSLTEPGTAAESTYLRLGDLYVKNATEAFVVINADCDLIYSNEGTPRPFPEDLSIMLCPGSLVPVEEDVKPNLKVTKLFIVEGKPFKIVWYHERVLTKRYDEVREWLLAEGYVKQDRLVAPHAMEIQHHFASNITRVGMPVAPPLPRLVSIQVFGRNDNGTLKRLGLDIPQGAIIDREGFRFTVEGFASILDRVNNGIEHYTALLESSLHGSSTHSKLESRINRLKALMQDCSQWFEIIETSRSIPGKNGMQLGSNSVFQVFCDEEVGTADCPIVLRLLSEDTQRRARKTIPVSRWHRLYRVHRRTYPPKCSVQLRKRCRA